MRIEYETQDYIQGCIKTCEGRKHLQQVAFSTIHNCLTQVCFTCNVCRTSLPELEQVKMKKNQSLKSFNKPEEVVSIPPTLGILETII